MKIDPRAEEALIDRAYAAAVKPAEWRNFLIELSDAVEADGGLIHAPPVGGAMPIPFVLHNIDPTPVLDKMQKYGRQAPFAERAVARGIAPGAFTNFAMIPPDELFEMEYYREYMTPTRTGDGLQLLVRLPQDETTPGIGITVGRYIDRDPFDDDALEFGRRLFPHVRRAALIAMEVYGEARVDPALAQAFDGFTTPCVLFDAQATPLLINAAAKAVLDAKETLEFKDGQVTPRSSKQRTEFDTMVRRCAIGDMKGLPRVGGEMLLPRPEGGTPLIAILIPLGPDNPFEDWSGPARAALYIVDVEQGAERLKGLRRARQLFGLSGAEEDILQRFLRGENLDEIARGRKVSVQTVRTQMKALLGKTQSRRQSDLARLRALGDVAG